MATLDEHKAQVERKAVLDELRKQRGEIASRLAKKDEEIDAAEDADFHARLGRTDVSKLGVKEKAEIVARIGAEKFLSLIGVR